MNSPVKMNKETMRENVGINATSEIPEVTLSEVCIRFENGECWNINKGIYDYELDLNKNLNDTLMLELNTIPNRYSTLSDYYFFGNKIESISLRFQYKYDVDSYMITELFCIDTFISGLNVSSNINGYRRQRFSIEGHFYARL